LLNSRSTGQCAIEHRGSGFAIDSNDPGVIDTLTREASYGEDRQRGLSTYPSDAVGTHKITRLFRRSFSQPLCKPGSKSCTVADPGQRCGRSSTGPVDSPIYTSMPCPCSTLIRLSSDLALSECHIGTSALCVRSTMSSNTRPHCLATLDQYHRAHSPRRVRCHPTRAHAYSATVACRRLPYETHDTGGAKVSHGQLSTAPSSSPFSIERQYTGQSRSAMKTHHNRKPFSLSMAIAVLRWIIWTLKRDGVCRVCCTGSTCSPIH
jgi:hypothetical protein